MDITIIKLCLLFKFGIYILSPVGNKMLKSKCRYVIVKLFEVSSNDTNEPVFEMRQEKSREDTTDN